MEEEEYKGGLVRLDDVHEVPLRHLERLSVNVPLPTNVGAERIGIDVARLETVCRIAGIRELDISTFHPEEFVVGAASGRPGADGTMSMNRVFSVAPALGADSFLNRFAEVKALRSILTKIQFNLEGILGKVADESKIGIRDVQRIADVMDFQLRKHLLLSGLKFLLTDVQKQDIPALSLFIFLSLLISGIASIVVANGQADPDAMNIVLPGIELLWTTTNNMAIATLAKQIGRKARMTLFQGLVVELDRALVLAVRLGLGGRLIDVVDL